jgi:hypothetical protein
LLRHQVQSCPCKAAPNEDQPLPPQTPLLLAHVSAIQLCPQN